MSCMRCPPAPLPPSERCYSRREVQRTQQREPARQSLCRECSPHPDPVRPEISETAHLLLSHGCVRVTGAVKHALAPELLGPELRRGKTLLQTSRTLTSVEELAKRAQTAMTTHYPWRWLVTLCWYSSQITLRLTWYSSMPTPGARRAYKEREIARLPLGWSPLRALAPRRRRSATTRGIGQ